MDEPASIELAWVENDEGKTMPMYLPRLAPMTYQQLLASAQILDLIERLGWKTFGWSVFGKSRQEKETVSAGDRIELLPPLRVDPNTARQRRAAHKLATRVTRACNYP